MSLTGSATHSRKVTPQSLLEKKQRREPITALTAYDYPTARLVDEAGIDIILVGDSLAMAVLGHENTLSVTVDEMLHHTRAVRRGTRSALLCADLPYGSYHINTEDTLRNATRFIKEAGAEAVKIEGGAARATLVAELSQAEIPVVGHLGLTPQSLHRLGGYRVQARSTRAIDTLLADATLLESAGAIAIVVEGVPREVAARIATSCEIPIIGIGAGPDCDGQILVFHDLLNLTFTRSAKFVRRFADAKAILREGIEQYREAVSARSFPDDNESYHLPADVRTAFEQIHAHTV